MDMLCNQREQSTISGAMVNCPQQLNTSDCGIYMLQFVESFFRVGVRWCGVAWRGVAWCGVVWCGVVWCGLVWFGMVWCGVVWCGVVWWVCCSVVFWLDYFCLSLSTIDIPIFFITTVYLYDTHHHHNTPTTPSPHYNTTPPP